MSESLAVIKLKVFGHADTYEFNISLDSTFARFKQMIQERGIGEASLMRLLSSGRAMADDATLASAGLKSGSTVHLVLRQPEDVAQEASRASSTPSPTPSDTPSSLNNIMSSIAAALGSGQPAGLAMTIDENGNIVESGMDDDWLNSIARSLNPTAPSQATQGPVTTVPRGALPPPSRWFPDAVDRAIAECTQPEREGAVHPMPYAISTQQVVVPLSVSINPDGTPDLSVPVELPPLDIQSIVTAASAQFRERPSTTHETTSTAPAELDIDATITTTGTPALSLSMPPVTAPSPLSDAPASYGVPLSRLASTFTSLAPALAAFAHEVHAEGQLTDVASVAVLRSHAKVYGSVLRRLGTAMIDLGSALNHVDWGEPEAPLGANAGHPAQNTEGIINAPPQPLATATVRGNTIVNPPPGVISDGSSPSTGSILLSQPPTGPATTADAPARVPARLCGPVALQPTAAPSLGSVLQSALSGRPLDVPGMVGGHIPLGTPMPDFHGTGSTAPNTSTITGSTATATGAHNIDVDTVDDQVSTPPQSHTSTSTSTSTSTPATGAHNADMDSVDAEVSTSQSRTSTSSRRGRGGGRGRGRAANPLGDLMGMLGGLGMGGAGGGRARGAAAGAAGASGAGGATEGEGARGTNAGANRASSGSASTSGAGAGSGAAANPLAGLMGMLGGAMGGAGGAGAGAGNGDNPLAGVMNMLGGMLQPQGQNQAQNQGQGAPANPLAGLMNSLMSQLGDMQMSDDDTPSTPAESLPGALFQKLLESGPFELISVVTAGNWAGLDKLYVPFHGEVTERASRASEGGEMYPIFAGATQGPALTALTDASVDDTLAFAFSPEILAGAVQHHPSRALQWSPAVGEASGLPATLAEAVARDQARFGEMSEEEYAAYRHAQGLAQIIGPKLTESWSYAIALCAFGPRDPANAPATSRHPAIGRPGVDTYMAERINAPQFAANINHDAPATAKGFGSLLGEAVIVLTGSALELLVERCFTDGEVSVNALVKSAFAELGRSPAMGDMGMLMGMASGMLGTAAQTALRKYKEYQRNRSGSSTVTQSPTAGAVAESPKPEDDGVPEWLRVIPAEERSQWLRLLEQDDEAQHDIHGYFFQQRRAKLATLGGDTQADVMSGGRVRVHPQPLSQAYMSGYVSEHKRIAKSEEATKHAVEYLQAKQQGQPTRLKGTVAEALENQHKSASAGIRIVVKRHSGNEATAEAVGAATETPVMRKLLAKQMLEDVRKVMQTNYPGRAGFMPPSQ